MPVECSTTAGSSPIGSTDMWRLHPRFFCLRHIRAAPFETVLTDWESMTTALGLARMPWRAPSGAAASAARPARCADVSGQRCCRSVLKRLRAESVASRHAAAFVSRQKPALALGAGAVGEGVGPGHARLLALEMVIADLGGGIDG